MCSDPRRLGSWLRSSLGGRSCEIATWILLSSLAAGSHALAGETLSDPTRPPASVVTKLADAVEEADQATPLNLQAIFFADGRRVAIINDRRVQERHTVAGASVVRIGRDRVRLERGGERLELRLVTGDVKRRRIHAPPAATHGPASPSPAPSTDAASPAHSPQGMKP